MKKVNVVHVGVNIAVRHVLCKLLKIKSLVNMVHVVHVVKSCGLPPVVRQSAPCGQKRIRNNKKGHRNRPGGLGVRRLVFAVNVEGNLYMVAPVA